MATASDGRTLIGTWSSDNPGVATVSPTGLVTPVAAGQATITFPAASGRVGTALLRGLRTVRGTFTGTYSVTSCTDSEGFRAFEPFCAGYGVGSLQPYQFTLTQAGDVVSRRFDLSAFAFDHIVGELRLDGRLTLHGTHEAVNAMTIDATWALTDPRPNTRGGTLAVLWRAREVTGQFLTGSLRTFSTPASTPARAIRERRTHGAQLIGR